MNDINPAPPAFRLDAATIQDPYPMFARLREADPVHRSPRGMVFLTRYADSVSLLKDARFGRAGMEQAMQRAHGLAEPTLYLLPVMFRDPPEHTRLRGMLGRAFTLRVVNALVPLIERVTAELLDRVAEESSFDLVSTVAYKLPISTICSLLGMPVVDHDRIHGLSEAHAMAVTAGTVNENTKGIIEHANRLRIEWADYFRALIEERRQTSGDDIISALVRVHDGTDKLTEYELLATILGLLFAGHTTTADTIGNGVLALLQHRDQWELLVRRPELLDSAVDEVLRWDPAVQGYARIALEDADVAGVPIPKGVFVNALSGAANRDPAQFEDPERFDITRTPNSHLTFGHGLHFCMGSTLARTQIKAVLSALRERYPKLALGAERPTYRPLFGFRGLTRLDVMSG